MKYLVCLIVFIFYKNNILFYLNIILCQKIIDFNFCANYKRIWKISVQITHVVLEYI